MTAICPMSRRVACSPQQHRREQQNEQRLVDCRKMALAAVVCLFACTYSSVVAAYAKPTMTVRQLQLGAAARERTGS